MRTKEKSVVVRKSLLSKAKKVSQQEVDQSRVFRMDSDLSMISSSKSTSKRNLKQRTKKDPSMRVIIGLGKKRSIGHASICSDFNHTPTASLDGSISIRSFFSNSKDKLSSSQLIKDRSMHDENHETTLIEEEKEQVLERASEQQLEETKVETRQDDDDGPYPTVIDSAADAADKTLVYIGANLNLW